MSEALFFEDRQGAHDDDDKDNDNVPNADAELSDDAGGQDASSAARPVWVDEDDDDNDVDLLQVPRRKKLRKSLTERNISATEYAKRIRAFYKEKGPSVHNTSGGWAELPSERRKREQREQPEASDDEQASDHDGDLSESVQALLRSTGTMLSKRKRAHMAAGGDPGSVSLSAGILDMRILPHANEEDPSNAEARCVEFHPSGRLLLTAGLDKTMRIFLVDGERSSKVQGIHVKNFPIHSAKFTGGGKQVVLTGRRRYFHQFDLNSGTVTTVQTLRHNEERSWENLVVSGDGSKLAFFGQHGRVVLAANASKQEVGQLRHNGRVVSGAFAPAGAHEHHFYSGTLDGTVYLWDVRKLACVDKHKDEGAVHTTCLAAADKHYALGSDSGVVNVYPSSAMSAKTAGLFGTRTAKPEKAFLNLTTQIDNVAFNADGQLMAFSSHVKKGAVRIAHIPSMTVFKNWPSAKTNVRRVCSLAFSPGSGYLAIGNDKGDVHMLRLKAYAAR